MRDMTAAMLAAIQAGTVRPVYIAEIEVADGYVRAWTGVGDLVFNAETFTGLGNLVNVSPVQEASDLKAAGITFSLSGIPQTLIATVLGNLQYNRRATLWFGCVEVDTNQLINDPIVAYEGLTDNAEITDGGETAEIKLQTENRLITLEVARKRRFTTEDQKLIDPSDRGFEFVPALQEAQIRWGRA